MSQRVQFSTRFLLLVMTAVAAGTAAIIAEPSAWSNLAINSLSFAFAAGAILGIAQTSGRIRAFWIGTASVLFPVAVIAAESGRHIWMYLGEDKWAADFSNDHLVWPVWCAASAIGLFSVVVHWLLWPHPRDHAP